MTRTEVTLFLLGMFAPATLVVIVAMLRGYNLSLHLRRHQKNQGNNSQPDD